MILQHTTPPSHSAAGHGRVLACFPGSAAPRLIIEFPAMETAEEPQGDALAALLELWTPREYFRHCARIGTPPDIAIRQRNDCRRCKGVAYPRLSRICWEEFRRMRQEAEEASR